MSEFDGEIEIVPVDIDLHDWVEAGRVDPVLYRNRQVTEIVLCAIGLTDSLKEALILKGGTLMAIAFKSRRATGDIDFTATRGPEGFEDLLKAEFDSALAAAARRLKYLDLICRIQTIEKKPRPEAFADHDFPALRVKVASARRGTPEEVRLQKGQATSVVKLEISFRDRVYAFQELSLVGANVSIQSFALTEIIAEKLRALLQQPGRNRYRRQDVYDIAFLVERFDLAREDKIEILEVLRAKCRTRHIEPARESIADPQIVERAGKDWETMKQEVGALPDFEDRYRIVREFYEALPW